MSTPVFEYLLLPSFAYNEMAGWGSRLQIPVGFVGGIQTEADDYKAIGLLIHQMAVLQKCFNKYLVKLLKCPWVREIVVKY